MRPSAKSLSYIGAITAIGCALAALLAVTNRALQPCVKDAENLVGCITPRYETLPWSKVLAAVCAVTAFFDGRLWFKSVTKLETIPYVPPVAEQLAALPANEILVRGSEEPAAAANELVRAASDPETTSDELLRPEGTNHGDDDLP